MKNLKCLGIKPAKFVEDLYDEKYKTFKKEIEKELRNGETYRVPGLAGSASSKCPFCQKLCTNIQIKCLK